MAQLPVEMWEEVFSFVPDVVDLKSISLVCKKFSDIVGSIPSLAGRFQLKLDGNQMTRDSMSTIVNSQRKYQKIQFEHFENSIKMLRISEKFEDSLNCLDMSHCTLAESTIQEKLAACKKIDTLKMSWNSIVKSRKRKRPGEDPEVGPLGLLSQFPSSTVEFKSLNAITKLDIEMTKTQSNDLMQVLKHQHHLKELIILFNGPANGNLFEARHLEQFKFKLTKFRFTCSLRSGFKNVLDFAISQHESLTHLAIKNNYESNHPTNLEAMEKLEYLSYYLHNNQQRFVKFPDSLKTLKITLKNLNGGIVLSRKMSNLENVELNLGKDTYNYTRLMMSIIKNCPKICKISSSKSFLARDSESGQCLIFTEHHFVKGQLRDKVFKFVLDRLVEVTDDMLTTLLKIVFGNAHLEIHNGIGLSGNFGIFLPHIGQNLKSLKIYNYPQLELDSLKQFHQERPDFRLYTSAFEYR
jgi:hypothetical protein